MGFSCRKNNRQWVEEGYRWRSTKFSDGRVFSSRAIERATIMRVILVSVLAAVIISTSGAVVPDWFQRPADLAFSTSAVRLQVGTQVPLRW
jgi:hypothetical protein